MLHYSFVFHLIILGTLGSHVGYYCSSSWEYSWAEEILCALFLLWLYMARGYKFHPYMTWQLSVQRCSSTKLIYCFCFWDRYIHICMCVCRLPLKHFLFSHTTFHTAWRNYSIGLFISSTDFISSAKCIVELDTR